MELIEKPSTTDEIIIHIHMVSGETHIQPLPLDHADGAIDLMEWFRDPKAGPVWTWQVPSHQKLSALHRIHIIAIEIFNFVEPENNKVRWYQRLLDKYHAWKITR